jgi:hypothetical protein
MSTVILTCTEFSQIVVRELHSSGPPTNDIAKITENSNKNTTSGKEAPRYLWNKLSKAPTFLFLYVAFTAQRAAYVEQEEDTS